MSERSYATQDKADWGPGPWQDEPDKVQWVDPATGLDCLAVRNGIGAWCGYVGVPPGHPWHGVDYDAPDVDVHGGLTFAAACAEDAPEGHGICHVPFPGREPDVWWLGFDCAHGGDLAPGIPEVPMYGWGPVYRDLGYVRAECERLAAQVHATARVSRVWEVTDLDANR